MELVLYYSTGDPRMKKQENDDEKRSGAYGSEDPQCGSGPGVRNRRISGWNTGTLKAVKTEENTDKAESAEDGKMMPEDSEIQEDPRIPVITEPVTGNERFYQPTY